MKTRNELLVHFHKAVNQRNLSGVKAAIEEAVEHFRDMGSLTNAIQTTEKRLNQVRERLNLIPPAHEDELYGALTEERNQLVRNWHHLINLRNEKQKEFNEDNAESLKVAFVNQKNEAGHNALDLAVSLNFAEIADCLTAMGATRSVAHSNDTPRPPISPSSDALALPPKSDRPTVIVHTPTHRASQNATQLSTLNLAIKNRQLQSFLRDLPSETDACINLSGFHITAAELKVTLKSIGKVASSAEDRLNSSVPIRALDLSLNRLGKEGAVALIDWMKKVRSLTSLDLSGNPKLGGGSLLTNSGVQLLAAALKKDNSLQRLMLRDANLNDHDMESLTNALITNNTLIHLDVTRNAGLTDNVVKMFDKLKSKRNKTSRLEIVLAPDQIYHFGHSLLDTAELESLLRRNDNYPNYIYRQVALLLSYFQEFISLNIYYMRNPGETNDAAYFIRDNTIIWHEYLVRKIQASSSLIDLLQVVENAIKQYQILGVMAKDRKVTTPERNSYDKIWTELNKLHAALMQIYDHKYWELHDPDLHEQVILKIFEDAICNVLQVYKTACRTHEARFFHREPITTGEKRATFLFEALSALLKLAPHVFGFIEFLDHSFGHYHKLVSEAIHLAYDEKSLIKEMCGHLPFLGHFMHELMNGYHNLIGKNKLERRLSEIATYFSGVSGKGRCVQATKQFMECFRDELVQLTPNAAERFARHLRFELKKFLLFSDLGVSMDNFITHLKLDVHSECTVVLRNGEEVNAYHLLRDTTHDIVKMHGDSALRVNSLFSAIVNPNATEVSWAASPTPH